MTALLDPLLDVVGVGNAVLDGPAIATLLDVPRSTVRYWAARQLLTRVGTDARGRALYRVADARLLAVRINVAGTVDHASD